MIKLEHVSFRYDGAEENSLSDISVEISRGECVVLAGASGSGKTTLTRLINGLIPHFYTGTLTGEVIANGINIQENEPHVLSRFVGSVFQNPRTQFFCTDTTSELVFGMENTGIPRKEMAERLEKTVVELELLHLTGRNIFALSGGEKQRIAFGGIYALSPEIYVLDEPTANLDAAAVAQLRAALLHVKKQGKTILIAEHRMHFLRDIADRIILMENGKITRQWVADYFSELSDTILARYGLRPLSVTDVRVSHERYKEKPSIEAKKLCLGYNRKTIFSDFSFAARKGEIVGIFAPNGTGKTTLARTLCGLHSEKSGYVRFAGEYVKPKQRNRYAYLVMQDPNYQLFSDSVEEELKLTVGDTPTEARIGEILNKLELNTFRQRHPLSLSGGQKQRLTIALAALSPADVLIFDEPTSGLDLNCMHRVVEMLEMLAAEEKTILVITHDNEFLSMGCHRVISLPRRQYK